MDTITSLQSQSYDNYEHIIVDGGSTDNTLEKIKAFADHRTNLASEPDNGIYDAINKGIGRATGDVIGLMHSDDFYASTSVLEKISAAFEDSSIDGVYGDLDYVFATNSSHVTRHWKVSGNTPIF